MNRGRRPTTSAARATPVAGAVILGAFAACSDLASTRDVRVTIVDERGEPIAGAVFYAEAADDRGAFAFLWSTSGPAGEVPRSAREPLKLPWRRGARLVMAAFAPGRCPAVVWEGRERLISDGAVLELRPGSPWNDEIARLGFPFEAHSALAARAREPSAGALAEAFRSAWAARPPTPLSPAESARIAALPPGP